MNAAPPAKAEKPVSQFEHYTSMARKIEAIRQEALTRVETDTHAAHVAHALARACSAAQFAARCNPESHKKTSPKAKESSDA